MTNELEKQFFDTFGIEEGELEYPDNFTYYPEITDHILLELICILHKYSNRSCLLVQPYGENIEQLKKETLTSLIIFYKNTSRYRKSIYNQVQELFKER